MGKYKQWLHHQEIGRRLRDQINTLEQERARVQQMAPDHVTSLPDTDNPLVAALINYTRAGNKLSNIDVIKAAMPDIGPDPVRTLGAGSSGAGPKATAAGGDAVVASLTARADKISSDPLQQMQDLSRAQDGSAAPGAGKPADSVSSWWQQHRQDKD